MSDDAEQNLMNYKLQLQQVDAALELDKDNEELRTLKTELEEVINLTLQLLGKDADELETSEAFGWKSGDRCMALWAKDKQYYSGVVTEVKRDGTCTVKFSHAPNQPEQCQVSLLKRAAASADSLTAAGSNQQAVKKRKREERAKALEVKARKAAKREERQKEREELVEKEKRSWQSFSKKIQKQRKVGKSIFATPDPDNPTGRVGVGTCGIAGRGMTPYVQPQYKPPGHQLPKI